MLQLVFVYSSTDINKNYVNKQSINNTSRGANSLKGDLSLAKQPLKNDVRAGVDTGEASPPGPVSIRRS